MTEDEQIALAIQMSMSESATPDVPTDTPSAMETDVSFNYFRLVLGC